MSVKREATDATPPFNDANIIRICLSRKIELLFQYKNNTLNKKENRNFKLKRYLYFPLLVAP